MTNINDITGDKLVSKHGNKEAFDTGYDRIFGKNKEIIPDDSHKECECLHWTEGCCGSSAEKTECHSH